MRARFFKTRVPSEVERETIRLFQVVIAFEAPLGLRLSHTAGRDLVVVTNVAERSRSRADVRLQLTAGTASVS